MNNFKPGDRVICISNTDIFGITSPTVNKIYIVLHATKSFIEIQNDIGVTTSYFVNRFKLLEHPIYI